MPWNIRSISNYSIRIMSYNNFKHYTLTTPLIAGYGSYSTISKSSNLKSTIDLTSDYVKTVTSQVLETSLSAATQRTYEIGDDNGIKITVTPFISPDGYVTLNLAPEYSTLASTEMAVDSYGNEYTAATLLKRRNLEIFNVRIKDGETLVLGGMVQENEKKVVAKVPLLGDLPGIGSIFRSTRTENEKSELVIMVTPHIITDTEDSVANNENL